MTSEFERVRAAFVSPMVTADFADLEQRILAYKHWEKDMSYIKVRLGVKIERRTALYAPYKCTLFHCRGRSSHDRWVVADWMRETIGYLHENELPWSARSLEVGESRRYWMHLEVVGGVGFDGEYEESVTRLSTRPAGKIKRVRRK